MLINLCYYVEMIYSINKYSVNFLETNYYLSEHNKVRAAAISNFLDLALAFSANHYILNRYQFGPLNRGLTSVYIAQASLVGVAVYTIFQVMWNYKKNPTVWHSVNHVFDGKCGQVSQLSLMLLFNMSYPFFVIHEYGHYWSALACFNQNKYPRVKIEPFIKGETSYAISNGLTRFGEKLGKKWALTFVQGSGLGSTTLFAMWEFGIASKIHSSCYLVSHIMDLHGQVQIFHDVMGGLTAFTTSRYDNSHDLKAIWDNTGINPLIPIGLAIGLPIVQRHLSKN